MITDLALFAIIAILFYGQIMRETRRTLATASGPDTVDRWLDSMADAAMEAYLRRDFTATVAGHLPRTEPAPAPAQREVAEHVISHWARVARLRWSAMHIDSDARRAAREAIAHEARMDDIRARLAQPMPDYLARNWTDDTGSFEVLVAEQQPWFNGTRSFAGVTP